MASLRRCRVCLRLVDSQLLVRRSPFSRFASSSSSAKAPNSSATPTTPEPTQDPTLDTPRSAATVGTPLKGLAYLKGVPDPPARPDGDYPAWLWHLLDTPTSSVPDDLPAASGAKGKTALRSGTARSAIKTVGSKPRLNAGSKSTKPSDASTAQLDRDQMATMKPERRLSEVEQRTQDRARRVAEYDITRKALAKKNKESIKTLNFLKS
ncbi:uncharacterized protein L969DRAFT_92038 [Mixia osmundae IAM 14324]|uniref:Large ribosomal subunit protein mL54 n=1 Tax=Mixia osmundae (strain CBS 9802 / IAM 14324 / JCM 22182 / KY 12970) TaxID=764103 RepID=G7DZC1_MIXOS|nr:uncharacterized protein L969DRAFT_92038 [Mixia osmundae IAM 14324]KEI42603.1 hypothetical protein L969DRAFT_92038 [Mixia osmundae IAM 14324]GAA95931.1 hypothetical protein E5Q_02589 [Mixia osmundae IAM 14324]